MLHENIVKNDSMCDILRYIFIVKLQNFLIAPHTATTTTSLPTLCYADDIYCSKRNASVRCLSAFLSLVG